MHTGTGGLRGVFACMLASGWMDGIVRGCEKNQLLSGLLICITKIGFRFSTFFFPSTSLFYPLRTTFPVEGLASSFSSDHICIYYESSFPFLFPELLLSLAVIVCSGVIDVCGGVFFWLDSIT